MCEILALIRWFIIPIVPCVDCSTFQQIGYIFVVETGAVVISLVSLVFPIFWFLVNTIGNAAVLSCCPLLVISNKYFIRMFEIKSY